MLEQKSNNCLCRQCTHIWYLPEIKRGTRCPICNSPKIKYHSEISSLSIAHIDCDSFYATIEKRDNPQLYDKAVLIGGENRGVVSAACYIARMHGVKSAMPMFKAKELCPHAVIIPPNMQKYKEVGLQIRQMMQELTPAVEPLSIDEAFLDLSGTEQLHQATPAQTLSRLINKIEAEVGISASVGLSHNKFLAKIASDLEKPKGFAIIGKKETLDFLTDKPVSMIWGVGKSLNKKLHEKGIETIGQLRQYEKIELQRDFGAMGKQLYYLCRGEDKRIVNSNNEIKSISNEITFETDISDFKIMDNKLWQLCEKVAARMKRSDLGARTITLKLKTKDFKLVTRSRTLQDPTMMAGKIYEIAHDLLKNEIDGRKFRLLGVGGSELMQGDYADPLNLADPDQEKKIKIESAIDKLRDKLGQDAIIKGRSLR